MINIRSEIFLLVGVATGAFMLWKLFKGMQARNWPTAPGIVTDSQVIMQYDDEGDRTYKAAITYRYDVDGLEYNGNRRSVIETNLSNSQNAEKIVSQFVPGSPVQVYYRPDDPQDAVLEPGTNTALFLILLLPLAFIGYGVAGLLGLF